MSQWDDWIQGSWVKIPKESMQQLRRDAARRALRGEPWSPDPTSPLAGVPVHVVNGEYFAEIRPQGGGQASFRVYEALGAVLRRGMVSYVSDVDEYHVYMGDRWRKINQAEALLLHDGGLSEAAVEELLAKVQEMDEEAERLALRRQLQAQQEEDDDDGADEA